jgi:hypothetical protein
MKWPDYSKHRPLFTDGWNSFWHFTFGVMAVRYLLIIPLFVAYQFIDIYEKNVWIDIGEFGIGFGLAYVLQHILYTKNRDVLS